MNSREKEILNKLQEGIPLCERPFLEIAKILETTEEEVISCLKKLEYEGLIRRFGGILDVNKMGVVSTLACVKVDKSKADEVGEIISGYEGITHNYERDDEYRIWFTVMESSQEKLEKTLAEIMQKVDVEELVSLPAIKKHKTKVFLKFE